jgi:hypothetical protein
MPLDRSDERASMTAYARCVARTRGRALVVGEHALRWLLGHEHTPRAGGGFEGCTEILRVRPERGAGELRIAFVGGAGRVVPDGSMHQGGVILNGDGGAYLNLNEPGVVRAFVDAALARGWVPTAITALDGWELFPEVTRARAAVARRAESR